jgi:TonB family protein
MSRTRLRVLATVGIVLGAGTVARAQESLGTARELYAAAAYEDALRVLDGMAVGTTATGDDRLVAQYRAFALLALGRTEDAERAIETIVVGDPSFTPSADEASPRVRAAFEEVRERMLPVIVQQKYLEARSVFASEHWEAAEARFADVLELLKEPGLADLADRSPLADYRILAEGFQVLSARAIPPPPPPPPPVVELPAAPAQAVYYDHLSADVVPPGTVQQWLPPLPPAAANSEGGVLEVVIDERGFVESASMITPLHPSYDALALKAAREWQYVPATREGVPVKYRKLVQIAVKR